MTQVPTEETQKKVLYEEAVRQRERAERAEAALAALQVVGPLEGGSQGGAKTPERGGPKHRRGGPRARGKRGRSKTIRHLPSGGGAPVPGGGGGG